jgi:hypothetical protein
VNNGAAWRQTTSLDECFLCGIPLTDSNKSHEDIFPKWLQAQLNLSGKKIDLLNRIPINYGRSKIPCCKPCNTQTLSRIENQVSEAFKEGLLAVQALPKNTLFLWLAKIHYGMHFLELGYNVSPGNSSSPTIADEESIRALEMEHKLLQSASGRIFWRPEHISPASILIFECLTSQSTEFNFDYFDDIRIPFVAMRFNRIGILAILQDWGKIEKIYNATPIDLKPRNLYPTQFREQGAQVLYLSLKNWRTKHFLESHNSEGITYLEMLPSISGNYWDSNLNEVQYADYLSLVLQTELDNVWLENKVIQLTKAGDNFVGELDGQGFLGIKGKPLWPYK